MAERGHAIAENHQGNIKMFNYTVHTEVEISASAERVWDVLTDLARYRDWNPMIREASGELKPGARLQLHFSPPGSKGWIFKPKLMVVEPGREFRWKGQGSIPLILESEHFFIIKQVDN